MDEVEDPRLEISMEDARELYPDCKEEDLVYVEVTPTNFCTLPLKTAKQVVVSKSCGGGRSLIYEEYLEREGEI